MDAAKRIEQHPDRATCRQSRPDASHGVDRSARTLGPIRSHPQKQCQPGLVEVLESRRQILILAQTPHPDVAALRQAMETNAHQETVLIWADELVNGFELPEHDVLVMHHIDPKTVPQDGRTCL